VKWTERKKIVAGIIWVLILVSCSPKSKQGDSDIPHMDMFASTKGDNHAFLGANVPFGTLQVGPQTKGASSGAGYNYNDSIITGFIISYTGVGEETLTLNHEDDIRCFPSTKHEKEAIFFHKYEVAKPGYYSVYMHESDIAVELTATKHAVFQRYFFPLMDSVQVVISRPLTIVNDSVLTGKTPSTYFVVQFSRPVRGIINEDPDETQLMFDSTEEEMLYIKIGISPKSIENAQNMLEKELPDWDFELKAAEANVAWNEYLIKE